nr:MAG TPA: holin [Caudoviricetes sp.]
MENQFLRIILLVYCRRLQYISKVYRKIESFTTSTTSSNQCYRKELYMINWKVRIRNRHFWFSLIPAILLLIQVIASVFNYSIDLGQLSGKLLEVVNAVFVILAILGIVTDPTTAGIGDSAQALTYERPKE